MKLSGLLAVSLVALLPLASAFAQGAPATSSTSSAESHPATTSSTGAAQATTAEAAGDWCAAHEVPESACTRCNKELIPQFKARGDWCASHDLPESQCRACNPKLEIRRP